MKIELIPLQFIVRNSTIAIVKRLKIVPVGTEKVKDWL